MAYLGRKGAEAPLTTADIPDNSITGAKIVAGTIEASDVAADMATQAELDLKANIASPTFTGTTNVASGVTLPAGKVSNVWRHKWTGGSLNTSNSTLQYVAHDSFLVPVISGRHYIINGSAWCSPYNKDGTSSGYVIQINRLIVGASAVSQSAVSFTPVSTLLVYDHGRVTESHSDERASNYTWAFSASYTASTTRNEYFYIVTNAFQTTLRARVYGTSDTPVYMNIMEVMP